MTKAPILGRDVKSTKRYSWRRCPYSTQDLTNRIPAGEKTDHSVTNGKMKLSIRNGHDGVGWVCEDPNCPYYLGTATTSIKIAFSKTQVNRETGEYTIVHDYYENPICSGSYFWEK